MVEEVIPKLFNKSEHERLHAEAREWRFPYWDWAAKKQRLGEDQPDYDAPLILKDRTVEVFDSMSPLGRFIPNPLYQFTAPGSHPMEDWGITSVPVDGKVCP